MAEAKADRVPMMAASIAFHSFLALFPAIIAVIGLAQLAHIGTTQITTLVNGIGKALPGGAASVLTSALAAAHKRTSGALIATVICVAAALWSASSAMAVLETGLDVAYEVPQDRKFLAKRVVGVELLVITFVLGGIAAALIVFSAPLGTFLQHRLSISGSIFAWAWPAVRWVVTVLMVSLLLAVLYRVAPHRQSPRWQWVSAGGLIGAVAWLLASLALSFYVADFGTYGKTYGAFAGVAVLMLWLYVTWMAVLFGGQLNAELERQAAIEGTSTGSTPPQGAPAGA